MNRKFRYTSVGIVVALLYVSAGASSVPARAKKAMVASQNATASQVGARVLEEGGTAVDAAVATAFALSVVHPSAGNIGGGGFLMYRPAVGDPVAFDFREIAPAKATPTMFLKDGKYDYDIHHNSLLSVGVPATALAATPAQCGANLFATGVAASGNANCAQPSAANLRDRKSVV